MGSLRYARGASRFRTTPARPVSRGRGLVVALVCLIPAVVAVVAARASSPAHRDTPPPPPQNVHAPDRSGPIALQGSAEPKTAASTGPLVSEIVVHAAAASTSAAPGTSAVPAVAASAVPGVAASAVPAVASAVPAVASGVPAVAANVANGSSSPPRAQQDRAPEKAVELGVVHVEDKLVDGEALSSALARHGVNANDVSALLAALKGKLDAHSIKDGFAFSFDKKPDGLAAFTLHTENTDGVPRTITARREEKPITVDDGSATFAIKVVDAPIETKIDGVSGAVKSSLYEAMLDEGEDANLVNKFVDVFAWNIDFYKQTRQGDEFKVLVEKKFAGGKFLGYGKVLAAEYVNAGVAYRGFQFNAKDGKFSGTFDDEGQALQRAFIKAPLEITHVTSHYGQRLDPFGNGEGFHHGIDYGAAMGTPIWSVGDGVIEYAKPNGGAGNMVKIKHLNGYETEYFHMSRFADGIKAGARVKQKQVIGYVGSTGYSTGPHLHFGMFKNGEHVDPSKQKSTNAAPVPKSYSVEFRAFMAPLLERLQELGRA